MNSAELPNSLTSDDVRKILAVKSGMDPEDIADGMVRLWRRSDAFKLLEAAMESGVLVRAVQANRPTCKLPVVKMGDTPLCENCGQTVEKHLERAVFYCPR